MKSKTPQKPMTKDLTMKRSNTFALTPLLSLSLLTLAVLTGCSTTPTSNAMLDDARSSYNAAQSTAATRDLAGAELKQAADALALADAAWTRRDSLAEVDHLAYLARQRVAIAEEIASRKTSELAVGAATVARDRVLLAARTRQADTAQMNAEAAQRQANEAQRQADASQRQAQASMQQAQASQQQSALSQQQARDAELRAAQLEVQLNEMNAKKTERGLVITIGDVLFDTNRAELKAGAVRNVDKLVSFLKQYPQRKALIEGFTDSVGSDSTNRELSSRRANAVRMALVDQGVGSERITAQGFGESYPVASNDSADGRQLNRRVEIVLSDEAGRILPR